MGKSDIEKETLRLAAAQRKRQIMDSARKVFAEKGPHGATTRELAKAAGVSEPILYRHFEDKGDLFKELERHCLRALTPENHMLFYMEPSTEALVFGIYSFVSAVARGTDNFVTASTELEDMTRIALHSLASDGSFARGLAEELLRPWVPFFERCIEVAITEAELDPGPGSAYSGSLILLSLSAGLVIMDRAGIMKDPDELVNRSVEFFLRGFGFRPESIQRLFRPHFFKAMQP